MTVKDPATELDARFSSEGAEPSDWADAERGLKEADVYWLSTVRPDGRPHVTTLLAVWLDGAMYFCTGPTERKAKNLVQNQHCILTTGCNVEDGLDLVLEGDAVRVSDQGKLQRIADAYETKYGSDWHFDVRDDAFVSGGGEALVYEVAPVKVFGFGKGDVYSQTRWRFDRK